MANTELVPVEPATLDAADLAELAETAEGLLDQTLYVVEERGQYIALEESKYKYDPKRPCIMKIQTASSYTSRQWPQVSLSSGRIESVELGGCDAVFWSEGAVEKILWPYYYSQRLYGRNLAHIRNRFKKEPSILAVAHTFPSHSKLIDDLSFLVQTGEQTATLMTINEFDSFKEQQRVRQVQGAAE